MTEDLPAAPRARPQPAHHPGVCGLTHQGPPPSGFRGSANVRHWRKIEGSRSEKSGSFPCPLPSGSRPVGSASHSSQLASESRAPVSLDQAAWPCLATPLPLDRHSRHINLREVSLKKPAYPGPVLCSAFSPNLGL